MRRNAIPRKSAFPTRGRILTALAFVLLLLLGMLVSSQIRTIAEEQARKEAERYDYARLADLIEKEKRYLAELRVGMDSLSLLRDSLQEAILNETGDPEALAALRFVNGIAGFTEVKGPGIAITLDDTDLRTPDMDPTASIIHDSDIRQVVDLLRAGGAIAISVNGQRIVATSELVCNGPTILINGLKYPVPYLVEAIGNPDLLLSVVETDETLGYRRAEGIRILIERREEIILASFDGTDRIDSLIDALEVIPP